jgi:tRNA(Ile2) C34 agmatinyltransferase TiaS
MEKTVIKKKITINQLHKVLIMNKPKCPYCGHTKWKKLKFDHNQRICKQCNGIYWKDKFKNLTKKEQTK